MSINRQREVVQPDREYRLLGVSLEGNGPFLRETKYGREIKATHLYRISAGSFIYSRLFAWRGAFGVVPAELDASYVSNEFPTYEIDSNVVLPKYLRIYFLRPAVWREVEKKCQGTTKASRNRFKQEFLLQMLISIPDIQTQTKIINFVTSIQKLLKKEKNLQSALDEMPVNLLASIYRGEL